MSHRKRFVDWCQRPSKIKIRTFNPRNFIVLITAFIILASSGAFVAQRGGIIPIPPITVFIPEDFETLTITTNTTLTKDYFNTTIVIAADGVTLDGDGHMIIGPGPDIYIGEDLVLDPNNPEHSIVPLEEFNVTVGILLEGRTSVTVKNCYVTGFRVGFFLKGSDGNILQGNTANNNTDGFGLLESSWNSFEANTVNYNGVGFILDMKQGETDKDWDLSEGNSFEANTANHNGLGFMVLRSDGNSFEANTANHNDFGFLVDLSEGNSFEANTVNYNAHFGFWSSETSNDTFRENTANNNNWGFAILSKSFGNILQGNTANNNGVGFELSESDGNFLEGNTANNSTHAGFHVLFSSSNNTLTGNTASNNEHGICYGKIDEGSPNNRIYHNNFVNNIQQVNILTTVNTWDDGYPAGGNYWSDYTGVDTNGDGIGDTPYVIDENNVDGFPLMAQISVYT